MRYPFADLIQQGHCLLLMRFEINNERAYFHFSHPRGPCAVSAAATRTPPSLCDFYDADEGNKAAFKEHTGHKSKDNLAKKLLRRTQVAWHHSSLPWQAMTLGSPGIPSSACSSVPRKVSHVICSYFVSTPIARHLQQEEKENVCFSESSERVVENWNRVYK